MEVVGVGGGVEDGEEADQAVAEVPADAPAGLDRDLLLTLDQVSVSPRLSVSPPNNKP